MSAFLAVCRVTGAERERLLALCADQHTPGWLQQHGARLPQQLITLDRPREQGGDDQRFPGDAGARPAADRRLRPRGYQAAANVPATEIDDRVAARLARQSLFSRERPARFTFYLHEFVLRLPVGGPR